ncbi:VCBS domain-containing protein, partial [Shewanella mangrovi]|uniref:VCBS domain-containing protein n=1 Tax=Shewanella mangrovi TaxID=1515746 RepID=UPI0012E08247
VVDGTPSVTGQLSATDVDLNDAQNWSVEVQDPANIYGTFGVDANGLWTYALDNSLAATQALNEGDTINLTFTVRVTDNYGAYVDQDVIVTITGTDDATIVESARQVWVPADSTYANPDYTDGYPLYITAPTDIDNALHIQVTGVPASGTVGYYDGGVFVELQPNDILTTEQLTTVVYIPADGQNSDADYSFTYNVLNENDEVTGQSTVTINTVDNVSEPSQSEQIGDGSSPLTSGNDQTQDIVVSQTLAQDLALHSDAYIHLLTDFNQRSNQGNPQRANDIAALEAEVSAKLRIAVKDAQGNITSYVTFMILAANNGVNDWTYAGSDLMETTVSYSNIYMLDSNGNQTSTTLEAYLLSNPAVAGDSWTIVYEDNNGGNYQARFVQFEFSTNVPGDPSVYVVGNDATVNTIFGSEYNDTLFGGSQDDIIYAREGNDTINGGSGNDEIHAGSGDDTVYGGDGDDTIYGEDGNDTIYAGNGNDTIYGGSGADTIDGGDGDDTIYGGDGNDTLIGGIGNDLLIGGAGNDLLTGGAGIDTFIWQAGDTGTDIIADFSASDGDKLDISELLSGWDSTTTTLDSYLSFSVDQVDGTVTISIDTDANGTVEQEIVLNGVDMSSGNDNQIINSLLGTDGPLIVQTDASDGSASATAGDFSLAYQQNDFHP